MYGYRLSLDVKLNKIDYLGSLFNSKSDLKAGIRTKGGGKNCILGKSDQDLGSECTLGQRWFIAIILSAARRPLHSREAHGFPPPPRNGFSFVGDSISTAMWSDRSFLQTTIAQRIDFVQFSEKSSSNDSNGSIAFSCCMERTPKGQGHVNSFDRAMDSVLHNHWLTGLLRYILFDITDYRTRRYELASIPETQRPGICFGKKRPDPRKRKRRSTVRVCRGPSLTLPARTPKCVVVTPRIASALPLMIWQLRKGGRR